MVEIVIFTTRRLGHDPVTCGLVFFLTPDFREILMGLSPIWEPNAHGFCDFRSRCIFRRYRNLAKSHVEKYNNIS